MGSFATAAPHLVVRDTAHLQLVVTATAADGTVAAETPRCHFRCILLDERGRPVVHPTQAALPVLSKQTESFLLNGTACFSPQVTVLSSAVSRREVLKFKIRVRC